jgi:sulfopyruvate decarboxylase TPP-binding subunit
VALVPDAGHARLIRRCLADNDMRVVPLTTEEEGIAMLFGAWLGGERGVRRATAAEGIRVHATSSENVRG